MLGREANPVEGADVVRGDCGETFNTRARRLLLHRLRVALFSGGPCDVSLLLVVTMKSLKFLMKSGYRLLRY
jgi:hypothetical protein